MSRRGASAAPPQPAASLSGKLVAVRENHQRQDAVCEAQCSVDRIGSGHSQAKTRKSKGTVISFRIDQTRIDLRTTSIADIIKRCVMQESRRHSVCTISATRSAMAGVDLATLKELMGHLSITTTMRYVHPTPEHKRKAVDKLEQFNFEQDVSSNRTKGVPTVTPSRDFQVLVNC